MKRRQFLQYAAGAAAIGGSGVILWGRHAYAKSQFQRKLLSDALPVLTDSAHKELQSVPIEGQDEICRWFHGKALKVHSFVDEICSDSYRTNLYDLTDKEQEERLLVSFCGKVVTDAEILNRVQTIAGKVGQILNQNWDGCCTTIASRWNVRIKEYNQPFDTDEFTDRIKEIIAQHVDKALKMAHAGTQYQSSGETIDKIGESALMVLPMSRIDVDKLRGKLDINPLAIPTFFLLALKHLFKGIIAWFANPRPDLQRSITAEVSSLGNRIGDEFQSEVRTRLAALHDWREKSVSVTARNYSDSVIGWF